MSFEVSSFAHAPLPLLSFFTGGGFLDMGFEKAGFTIPWTNEAHPGFVKLYEEGVTAWRKARGQDVPAKISSPSKLEDLGGPSAVLDLAFGSQVPPLFGVIGGPPCQDFSIAGQRAGFAGARGSLTHEYVRHVQALRPAFFVMENVIGLLQKRNKPSFDQLRESLGSLYLTDVAKLNALDYGVPQSRERMFMIGIRRDLIVRDLTPDQQSSLPTVTWAQWEQEQDQKIRSERKRCHWGTVEPAGITPKKPTCPIVLALSVGEYLVPQHLENSVPNAADRFRLNSEKAKNTPEGMVSNRCFKRLHRYRYSPTACYGNNEVHLHPWLPQRLSVREVLRIQGVEDSYVLPQGAPLSIKFKMIGNGVPVPLAEGVARTVLRCLDEYCSLAGKRKKQEAISM